MLVHAWAYVSQQESARDCDSKSWETVSAEGDDDIEHQDTNNDQVTTTDQCFQNGRTTWKVSSQID